MGYGEAFRLRMENEYLRNCLAWLSLPGTPAPAWVIFRSLTGFTHPNSFEGDEFIPLERTNIKACLELLEVFPAFRSRLPEVARMHPCWEPYVERWYLIERYYKALDLRGLRQVLEECEQVQKEIGQRDARRGP
jgi:hypothetical protein